MIPIFILFSTHIINENEQNFMNKKWWKEWKHFLSIPFCRSSRSLSFFLTYLLIQIMQWIQWKVVFLFRSYSNQIWKINAHNNNNNNNSKVFFWLLINNKRIHVWKKSDNAFLTKKKSKPKKAPKQQQHKLKCLKTDNWKMKHAVEQRKRERETYQTARV